MRDLLSTALLYVGMIGSLFAEGKETIQVLPVPRTPESKTVLLAIAFPESQEVVPKNPVWVQFRLDGYPLGAGSQFDRADEVVVSSMGQTVHVIVDNQPYFPVEQPAIDPFNEEGSYYDTSYKFRLLDSLSEGLHTIRMFPARSFGESLKGENTFYAVSFYVGEVKDRPVLDLHTPYLTYNEPGDQIPLSEGRPILLDFYLRHCELTPDGYKVRLTIDRKIKRNLTSWQPYYIYGLRKGRHTIRLELIDAKGKKVPGLFND